jgi:hypothetical protein
LGHHRDGPLEGICSRPCHCPGNCKNPNRSGREIQPNPEPVEGKTKGSKSNTSE